MELGSVFMALEITNEAFLSHFPGDLVSPVIFVFKGRLVYNHNWITNLIRSLLILGGRLPSSSIGFSMTPSNSDLEVGFLSVIMTPLSHWTHCYEWRHPYVSISPVTKVSSWARER